jgi:hypothetical protein
MAARSDSTVKLDLAATDPNLFLPEADSKDLVVPVYHRCIPAIGFLANHAT